MDHGQQRLLRDLFSELSDATTAHAKAKERVAALQLSLVELKQQLAKQRETRQNLESSLGQELGQLRAELIGYQRKSQELGEQLRKSAAKLAHKQQNAQSAQTNHRRELQQAKQLFAFERKQLNGRIDMLQRQLKQTERGPQVALEISKNDLLAQYSRLRHENQFLNELIASEKKRGEFLLGNISALKRELDLARDSDEQFARRNSQLSNIVKTLTRKVRELETRFAVKEANLLGSRGKDRRDQVSMVQKKKGAVVDQDSRTLKEQNAALRKELQFSNRITALAGHKYQTLGMLLSQFLGNLVYGQQMSPFQEAIDPEGREGINFTLDLNELKKKPVQEWSRLEQQSIVHLILAQIKPYLSKRSLLSVPDARNINLTFVQQTAGKDVVNLPRIVKQQESAQERRGSKFRNIPVQMSSKIVRSQLRDWGRGKAVSERKR